MFTKTCSWTVFWALSAHFISSHISVRSVLILCLIFSQPSQATYFQGFSNHHCCKDTSYFIAEVVMLVHASEDLNTLLQFELEVYWFLKSLFLLRIGTWSNNVQVMKIYELFQACVLLVNIWLNIIKLCLSVLCDVYSVIGFTVLNISTGWFI